MDVKQVSLLIMMGVLHFMLAGMLIEDLANRKRILGGKKAPWAVAILFIAFAGSLLYLLCHPRIFYGREDE